jgi:DNA (cytosine-5)-methyltransferase 1
MVWENVPGAFSSRKGEDFRAVLEETARVKDKNVVIPGPADGKWRNAGVILGDGWSIAWRVLDAQFWGVPQRRRRIALVADFGGHTAPEILFERSSLSGDSETGRETRKGIAGDAEDGVGAAVFGETGIGYWQEGVQTLRAEGENRPSRPSNVVCLNDQGGSVMGVSEDVAGTLRAQEHGHQPVVHNEETITSKANASNPHEGDPCHTLGATGAGRTICIQGNCIDRADTAGCNGKG